MTTDNRLELVRQAFEMARRSGKADWTRMTLPVLKNRILTLTRGAFDHSQDGSFRDFVKRIGSPIKVDESAYPPVAILEGSELRQSEGLGPVPAAAPTITVKAYGGASAKIRPDLWRAILDYSGGRTYVWDQSQKLARPGSATEGLILPTVTKEDFARWRTEFASSLQSADPVVNEKVNRWRDLGLPTMSLPANFRPLWNVELKKRVLARTQEWFEHQRITPPADLVQGTPDVRGADEELKMLRRFVCDCIARMSWRELTAVQLPAGVLWRMQQRGDQDER